MIYCRWSPTLGKLESTHQKVWGTKKYNPKTDITKPCVFFGIYGLPDFYALWRHHGKRYVLWAGTDITHFMKGYWLDDKGSMVIDGNIGEWIGKYCENWCENEAERRALETVGIKAKVCPSYLGDIKKFKVTYKHTPVPRVYASVSGNEFEKYGWDLIERIADKCNVDFHLYGNTIPFKIKHPNVIVHGRVSKQKMNWEVAKMQCGLRTLEFDGFSEILAKSVLMGQYPISRIRYPHIAQAILDRDWIREINALVIYKKPNLKARNYYLKKLNNYPWVSDLNKVGKRKISLSV